MFSVKEILAVTKGKLLSGKITAKARRVLTDSREVKSGDLFIAIKGEKHDAHQFIDAVIANKASIVLVEQHLPRPKDSTAIIYVKNTVHAMGALAAYHRNKFKVPVIAITGSAGKTTTKEMLAAILKKRFRTLYNVRSFNNHIGVPLTLFQLNKKHQVVVLECGTNQPGDIKYLAKIIKPTVVIITNIGASHLEKLKTIDGVLREKWQLVNYLAKGGKIFINADDGKLSSKKGAGIVPVRCLKEGVTDKGYITGLVKARPVALKTAGLHQLSNAALAISCAHYLGVGINTAIDVLKRFKFPEGRGQVKQSGTLTIIDETYNANPLSMRAAIDLLAVLQPRGRRVLIVGDMRELGKAAIASHQEIGKYIAQKPIHVLLSVGQLGKIIGNIAAKHQLSLDVYDAKDSQEAAIRIDHIVKPHDAVLIKGSHALQMDKIVKALLNRKG